MKLKNKILIYILLLCFSHSLYAEWETITLKEHVEKSSLIVVADFAQEVEKKEGRFGDISQLVSFEAKETIKGEVEKQFFVKGQSIEACMPQMLFPKMLKAKYLLFLEQEGNTTMYNLVHGERSALLVTNGFVGWVFDKSKIDLGETVATKLSEVKKEIEKLK